MVVQGRFAAVTDEDCAAIGIGVSMSALARRVASSVPEQSRQEVGLW